MSKDRLVTLSQIEDGVNDKTSFFDHVEQSNFTESENEPADGSGKTGAISGNALSSTRL